MSKISVHIDGYGVVKVKVPKKLTRESYTEGVATAVAATMQLVDPRTQSARFHPALGIGGHAPEA